MQDQTQTRGAPSLEGRALQLAATQHGTLSPKQAQFCGFSSQQIRYRVQLGRWRLLASGALLIAEPDLTYYSEIAGACAVLGGVASHRTAGMLWGICDRKASLTEITVPRSRYRRRRTIEIYSTTQFELAEATMVNQIPTTSPARTALDLATVVTEQTLRTAIERLLGRELATTEDLSKALAAHSIQGRPGIAKFRCALDGL